jgi:mRNA interferase MazF
MATTPKIGDVYWLITKSKFPHPHVVISVDRENVMLCQITTNAHKAIMPGNVSLEPGEAGLNKPSIVEVSKQTTVRVTDLGELIGKLTPNRLEQILAGAEFVQKSFFPS